MDRFSHDIPLRRRIVPLAGKSYMKGANFKKARLLYGSRMAPIKAEEPDALGPVKRILALLMVPAVFWVLTILGMLSILPS